jgi:hypothetical protein
VGVAELGPEALFSAVASRAVSDNNAEPHPIDVAFSFLSADEGRATEINDLIQDRLKTFIYSRRQGEIVGHDGEKAFAQVFGRDARIVVVIYREGWGETPFTRIEETAIRNRAFENGYDFTIFIPVDRGVKVPAWLPKTQLWLDLDRWGPSGAASIIEDRVRAAGGTARVEGLADRTGRLARAAEADLKNRAFRFSEEGVDTARESFRDFAAAVGEKATAISQGLVKIGFKNHEGVRACIVWHGGFSVLASWASYCRNSLDESTLKITEWKGRPAFPNEFPPLEKPEELQLHEYDFVLGASGVAGWQERNGRVGIITPEALAERCVGYLLDLVERDRETRGDRDNR